MKRPRILSQFFLQIQLCLALGISFQSWSEPILFKPKSHRALFKADFFSSEDNFDPQDGTFEKLGPGHYYKINSYHFEWDYLPSNRLAWRVGLRVNQGESSDGTFARKNSALADGFLGLQYYLRATPLKMKPEIMLVFSQQKIDPNTDDLIISEGAHEIKLGSWFQKKFLTLDHYAYLGVNYRTEGRSSLGEYSIGTKKDFDGLGLGVEVGGFQTIADDESTQTPTDRQLVVERVNGKSLKFYSLNPGLLTLKAYLQAQLSESFFIKGGYGIDIQGKNTSRGQSILLELAWDFNATQREFTKTRRIEKSKSDLEKFDIESTEYNESLFREESPQPMRRKKKKSVKQMLDEAEEMLDK